MKNRMEEREKQLMLSHDEQELTCDKKNTMTYTDLEPHGGNINKEASKYGVNADKLVDFSANINPIGMPYILREAIIEGVDNLINYPDPHCTELKTAISKYLGVNDENIIVGNGASEIISLVFEVLRPQKVLIPAPSFSEYAQAAKRFGVEVIYIEIKEEDSYSLDFNAIYDRLNEDIDAVLLCNPNNPTSTLIQKEELLKLVKYVQSKNKYIIVDEAFIELTDKGNNNSVADLVEKYNSLFVIRAFTKVFAIPGLRLGYGVGEEHIIKKMWDKKIPWSINTFAADFGKVLTQSEEYFNKTHKWLMEEKEFLFEELDKIRGIRPFKPETNFILVKILRNKYTSSIMKDILALKGILVRDASNFVYLNDQYIRVAVKDRTSNIKLVDALKEEMERE